MNPPAPEPRFAKVAAMIADPTRARMLAALLGGQALPAGELAAAAGVTAATASGHLAKLADAGLLGVRQQGRHRYYRIADADIARALEALSLVAEADAGTAKWRQPAYRPLKHARRCYGHLAGELGVRLFDGLRACGHLRDEDGEGFVLTPDGAAAAAATGLPVPPRPEVGSGRRRWAYACLDWSERRDHLAGTLAGAWLAHALQADWLRAQPGSRALALTPPGAAALGRWLEAAPPR